ncbi:MAG: hypothetical protein NT163_06785 [Chlorobiales bacterium]|nr:hypothetical protein [Chlorobiales bacterium]
MNARGKFRYALLLAGTLCTTAPCYAAQTEETVDARITRLEQELAELKTLVKTNASAPAALDNPIKPAPAKNIEPLPITVSPASGVKVQLYGFARLDASYDTGKIYPGNIALFVRPQGLNNHDNEWDLTAAATRLGLNLSGPDTDAIKLSGNIEMDFLSGVSENNMNPRMRHAYLKAYWPSSDFSIIAGQTWDVISSLIPFVEDPAIMWDAGNIGSRHPQLRLTKGFKTSEQSRIELTAAASRTIGEPNSLAETWNTDPGKDAGMPTIQGKIAFSEPLLVPNQPATIALSGHYGQEEWDTDKTGTHKTLDSWSCDMELSLPLSEKLLFAGEYFTGSNLDDYWGGIGQGVNTVTLKEIRSHGGWTALKYNLNPVTTISLGAGIDNPNDNDLPLGGRTLNQTIFATFTNKITSNCILGLQLSQWKTDYTNAPESNAFRAQTSMTYKF